MNTRPSKVILGWKYRNEPPETWRESNILEVDYENDNEWGVGVLHGMSGGFDTTGPELAKILRKMADLVEVNFPKEAVPVAYGERDTN